MTSCQTSRAIQMPNDTSLNQTARKTAATHTVPTQDKAYSVELNAAAHAGDKATIQDPADTNRTMRVCPDIYYRSMHVFILITVVAPQACIQHRHRLLHCETARWKYGESHNQSKFHNYFIKGDK